MRPFLDLKPEAGGNARHGEADKVVQVAIGGVGQLQCPEKLEVFRGQTTHVPCFSIEFIAFQPEADVVEGFVVNAESLQKDACI